MGALASRHEEKYAGWVWGVVVLRGRVTPKDTFDMVLSLNNIKKERGPGEKVRRRFQV